MSCFKVLGPQDSVANLS